MLVVFVSLTFCFSELNVTRGNLLCSDQFKVKRFANTLVMIECWLPVSSRIRPSCLCTSVLGFSTVVTSSES